MLHSAEAKFLGRFTIDSGKVVIGDPCYELDVWCLIPELVVKNGVWQAATTLLADDLFDHISLKRNADLVVWHTNHDMCDPKWVELATFGVDSGQAGVFDKSAYRNDDALSEEDLEFLTKRKSMYGDESRPGTRFYSVCCNTTITDDSYRVGTAGVLSKGAVSASGYGDGGYQAYTHSEDGLVVGIKLVFIYDSEEEETTDDNTAA